MDFYNKMIVAVGGWFASVTTAIFGVIDLLPMSLLWFMLFDMISGLVKGCYTKKLDSEIMFKGLLKKGAILLVIALSHRLDIALGMDNMLIRNTACTFYMAMEGLSVVENIGQVIQLPKFIVDLLKKLQSESDQGGTTDV